MNLDEILVDYRKPQWFAFDEETSFLIDNVKNEKYKLAIDKYNKHVQRQEARKVADKINNGESLSQFSIEVSDGEKTDADVHAELAATFLLQDWKGVKKGGKDLPYDVKTATKLLIRNTALFLFVLAKAQELHEAEEEEVADTKKKSSKRTPSN